jgi:hypothetical protein
MSVFDFRELIERSIPAWVIAIPVVAIVLIVAAQVIQNQLIRRGGR